MKISPMEGINHMNSRYNIILRFKKQPLEFALHNFAYYQCWDCKKPYFGGMRRCDQNNGDGNSDFNEQELICGSCVAKKSGHVQSMFLFHWLTQFRMSQA
jgi:hypothetical protein